MPPITGREWRIIGGLALLILIITTFPYAVAWANAGESWLFGGALIGVEDMNSYLGKLRIGARGGFDFMIFYTAEAHAAALGVFLPYILPGWIVGRVIDPFAPALTPALIVAFHVFRALAVALLVIATYALSARFLDRPRDRTTATLLATFAGGLGWLLLPLAGGDWLGSPPPDIFIPEGFGFLVAYSLPHVALARAALMGGLVVLTTRPLLAGMCWLIVGLCVPFYLAVIYAILGAWGLAAWIIERRFPRELFAQAVMAAGITLPLFAYLYLRFNEPVFAAWSAQNILTSPHPLHYALAYLPIAVPAVIGARKLWRSAPLLIGWVLIVPLLVYVPINVQRRLSEGVMVALAILAAAGLRQMARLPRAALLICLFATSGFLLVGGVMTAARPALPAFRPADEIAAFNWLNANAEAQAIILAAVESGNALPAWTHLRVYMGHGPETIDWQTKTARLTAFYRAELTDAEAADLLARPCANGFACAGAVDYVLWGARERALARRDEPPPYLAGWRVVYDDGGYVIYARD